MSMIGVAAYLCFATAATAAQAQGSNPKDLVALWAEYNDRCRGGAGDRTEAFCQQRDDVDARLGKLNYCFGHEGEPTPKMWWHRCDARSLRPDKRRISDAYLGKWHTVPMNKPSAGNACDNRDESATVTEDGIASYGENYCKFRSVRALEELSDRRLEIICTGTGQGAPASSDRETWRTATLLGHSMFIQQTSQGLAF